VDAPTDAERSLKRYYAVFCFTDYRKVAAALDLALPRRSPHS
jgi:hypothetical protein